jgi:hypothetical protein
LTGVQLDPQTGELKTPPGFRVDTGSSSIELHWLVREKLSDEFEAAVARAVLDTRARVGSH